MWRALSARPCFILHISDVRYLSQMSTLNADNVYQCCRFKQGAAQQVWEGKLVEEPYTEYILSLYHAVMVRACPCHPRRFVLSCHLLLLHPPSSSLLLLHLILLLYLILLLLIAILLLPSSSSSFCSSSSSPSSSSHSSSPSSSSSSSE